MTKSDRSAAPVRQFLTVSLAEETYALDILSVQEILAGAPITPIPTAPFYVKGVINIRGTVSPVIGLREKLGLPAHDVDPRKTVIVVVVVSGKAVGLIVDAVTDVLDVSPTHIEALPELGASVDTSFIEGVVRQDSKFAIVLRVPVVVGEAPTVEAAGEIAA